MKSYPQTCRRMFWQPCWDSKPWGKSKCKIYISTDSIPHTLTAFDVFLWFSDWHDLSLTEVTRWRWRWTRWRWTHWRIHWVRVMSYPLRITTVYWSMTQFSLWHCCVFHPNLFTFFFSVTQEVKFLPRRPSSPDCSHAHSLRSLEGQAKPNCLHYHNAKFCKVARLCWLQRLPVIEL